MSSISKIDFLSGPVNIKIRGNTKAKSLFGAATSLFFFILALLIFILLGKELVEKKNPLTSTSEIQSDETKVYLKDYPIALYVQGERGEDITQQVLEAGLVQAVVYRTAPTGQTTDLRWLKLVECTEEIVGKYFEILDTIKITKYCIHPSESSVFVTKELVKEDIYFNKGFLEADSDSITISLKKGENFIPPHESFYFSINTIENILDERDYSSPIKPTLSSLTRQFDKESQLKLEPVIQISELVTDKGWLVSEEEKETYFSNVTVKEFIRPIEGVESDLIVRVEFTSSKLRKQRYREYLKIPGLLANFGGAIKVLQFVFAGVMKIYSEFVIFDYIWELKKEEVKKCPLEIRNKEEFKGKLTLKEFLHWKVLFSKPTGKIIKVNDFLELKKILEKPKINEKLPISRLKVNASSLNLVNS